MVDVGSRVAAYEITALIGVGGMGRVFRARDTRLKRDVAIKALPEALAVDPDRIARFQREAETLASLNHPHIAGIYDLVDCEGSQLLVMELVEGETLSEKLSRLPAGSGLAVGEALDIAHQIADALEAAHARGIVHRDLKPSNLKITADGCVKVLDFGLAKVRDAPGLPAALSQSPTMMTATIAGTVLGTAAYMAPEQANGKAADHVSDVWAFGCVLYEMVAGRAVFEGESVGEILGGIFKEEPDWRRLPPDTPPDIRRLIKRCLQKDRRQRLQHIGDARIEIDEARREPSIEGPATVAPSRHRERLAWAAAAILALTTAMAVALLLRPAPAAPEMRVEITTPPTLDPSSLAISPDGHTLAFVATSEGQQRLWVRPLQATSAHALAGTDGAYQPFWSPDNRSLAFFAASKLKRVDVAGGAVQTLANVVSGRGGAWNDKGVILFSRTTGPIFRIPAEGGEPVPVTRVEPPRQANHRFPRFLPDGRHFLFYAQGTPESRGVYVGSIDDTSAQRLLDADTAAELTSTGHLLFSRGGTLFRQAFDSVRRTTIGDPLIESEAAPDHAGYNAPPLSASAAGPLAYRTAQGSKRQLLWFDRLGRQSGAVGGADTAAPVNPELSSDGRRVALDRFVGGNRDIWLLETERGGLSRFTFDPAVDIDPIWSPDGSRIVFASNRKGVNDLYQKSASGADRDELLLESSEHKRPQHFSPDGRFLIYRVFGDATGWDLWALPLEGDRLSNGRTPFRVAQTGFDERDAQFSPDGKWIAYRSDESGRLEVYVQAFPQPAGKWRASVNGGSQPRWRSDGRELFYVDLDNTLMSVRLKVGADGRVEAETQAALFPTRILQQTAATGLGYEKQQYAVSSDGQRFLINSVLDENLTAPIVLILNWAPPARK